MFRGNVLLLRRPTRPRVTIVKQDRHDDAEYPYQHYGNENEESLCHRDFADEGVRTTQSIYIPGSLFEFNQFLARRSQFFSL